MKLYKFNSIKTRLIFWFLIIALIPLITAIVITYNQRVNVIKTRTFDKLTAIRDLKVEHLDFWIEENSRDIMLLSRNLEEITSKENLDKNDQRATEIINNRLGLFLKHYSSFHELSIINPKTGVIQISTNRLSQGLDKSQYPYFTEPMETRDLFINDIHYSKLSQENEMVFSAPIFCNEHDQSHIIGILAARVDLKNSLYKMLLDRVGLGKTGETLIVNKDVLALNELRWHENVPLNLQINAKPAIYASQGKTGITVTSDYRGEKVLAAYTFIPETGWGFVCKQDIYELYEPIRDMIYNFIVLFLLSTFLIYITAYFIGNALSKPIFDMFTISQKVKSGDLSVRNEINSEDELGSLALSINELTDSIESKEVIQHGVMGVSGMLIEQSSIHVFGRKILQNMMDITNSNMGVFYILNEMISKFEPSFSIGANEALLKTFNFENPEGEFGNVLSSKSIYYLKNIPEETVFRYQTTAGDIVPKEIITIPILVENNIIAIISLINIHNFSKESYIILQQSWLNINASYSSLIANERTRILAENLAQANQKLEAQTEELQAQTEELQRSTQELQNTSENILAQNIELESQRQQVEEANRLKSQFLSNMSHELRTPLNSILTLSKVLIDQTQEILSTEQSHYLEIIERNGKQLLQLINDILDLSRIEAGFAELHINSFNISSTILGIAESLSPLAHKKNLELKANIPEDIPYLESDELKIHRILTNIVGNAIKFTEAGSVIIDVSFDTDSLVVKVKDTGIGIHPDMISSIFREFHQVDSSLSRSYEGTGLGLAIVYKSTQLLEGDIAVESNFGEGSTFTLKVPLKWPQSLSSTENITITHSIADEPKSLITSEKRILVVDDNDETIMQINYILETAGYIVDIALGGQQALDYLSHTSPDGIVLDLMMPDVDGFKVLDAICKQNTLGISVMVLTAMDLFPEELEKLKSYGVFYLIQKGAVNKNQLLSKVFDMLENKPELSTNELDVGSEKNKKRSLRGSNFKTVLPTILIIEDNMDNLTSLKAILRDKYNLQEANDGKQGLKMTLENMPDLVILDIMLPLMDGYEVVKRIKADKKARDIPVIALTGKTMMGDREKILAAGCNDYLTKPIDPEKIQSVLKKWLSL
ncbi:MAG: response regulator [Candidatus Marinimicrobia bacterium]|jgi:signal transduction histidine kinase/DNA-binding response OmpR family regulator/HAMP domain-containing protein|nr:response regulator [Candidatus Neomarinimicrobiota bacterium]MBT3683931.1 response regulator [Candidatus Neomarinimicrobiota bacterium]MBT3760857.1 response regulator [Candidatus Neomarinimicrobiota bacterium]MBT3896901.1 response regulator [Candidatus Neomarinimicrobiota bacterium]MBT4173609.1 response regulator [Candidatus Neomarinimicrobiota bacterium]